MRPAPPPNYLRRADSSPLRASRTIARKSGFYRRTALVWIIAPLLLASSGGFLLAELPAIYSGLSHSVVHSTDGKTHVRVAATSHHPGSGVDNLYNLTFQAVPNVCFIGFDTYTFVNGEFNTTELQGYHSISAPGCPGWAFSYWSTDAGSFTNANVTPTYLDLTNNGSLTAHFVRGWNVSFSVTGLPLGNLWTVDLAGSNQTLSGQILYEKGNGTYHYSIAPQPGFQARMSGTVSVAGADTGVTVAFHSITYDVEFVASGLPAQTFWSVTLNGSRSSTISPALTFALVNGTFNFTVWDPPGYHTSSTTGSVMLSGATVTVPVHFSQNSTGSGTPSFTTYMIVAIVGIACVAAVGLVVVYRRSKPRSPA